MFWNLFLGEPSCQTRITTSTSLDIEHRCTDKPARTEGRLDGTACAYSRQQRPTFVSHTHTPPHAGESPCWADLKTSQQNPRGDHTAKPGKPVRSLFSWKSPTFSRRLTVAGLHTVGAFGFLRKKGLKTGPSRTGSSRTARVCRGDGKGRADGPAYRRSTAPPLHLTQ